ncbi:HNH endonuclease [Propionibacteriaceae bacterium G57]|uniref:HNH endonuclease n=1 Tax=Aestuariimicrobium sp. G57 TaxID=3418485 RepID=UPI003DA76761
MAKNTIRDRRFYEVTTPAVMQRDGYQCVACGATDDLTVDHVKPVDLFTEDDWAGDLGHDIDQCVTLCRSCNSTKGARTKFRLTWYSRRWFPDGLGFLRDNGSPHLRPTFSQNEAETFGIVPDHSENVPILF